MADKRKGKRRVPETGPAGDAAREDILDAFACHMRRPRFLDWLREGADWWQDQVSARAKVRGVHIASHKLRMKWWDATGSYEGGPVERPRPDDRLMATPGSRTWRSLATEERNWLAALRLCAFLATHRAPLGSDALPRYGVILKIEVADLSNRVADQYLSIVTKAVDEGVARPLIVSVVPDDVEQDGPPDPGRLWPHEVASMIQVFGRLLTRSRLLIRKWGELDSALRRRIRQKEPEGWRTTLPPGIETFQQLVTLKAERRGQVPGASDWHPVWDALDDLELSVRLWRRELHTARQELPSVSPWTDNTALPPVERWTARAQAALNHLGGLLPEFRMDVPGDLDVVELWAAIDRVSRDLAALKSIPKIPAARQEDSERIASAKSNSVGSTKGYSPGNQKRGISRKRKRLLWQIEAALLLHDNPAREHRDIAKELGISPGTLSRSDLFQTAVQLSKEGGVGLMGFIEAQSKSLEAVDPGGSSSEDDSTQDDRDDRLDREFDEQMRKRNPKRN